MKNKTLTGLVAGMFAAAVIAIPNVSVKAEEIYVNNSGQACVRNVNTSEFVTPTQDTFSEARDSASDILNHFFSNTFEKSYSADSGLITTDFFPSKTSEGNYDALCDVCSTIEFSPDEQDKMLNNLGVIEEPIHTKVYGAIVVQSNNGTKSSSKVRTYVVTTRSRPYVDAMDEIMDNYRFSNDKKVSVLKDIADENGVIHKDQAAKMYEKWIKIIDDKK